MTKAERERQQRYNYFVSQRMEQIALHPKPPVMHMRKPSLLSRLERFFRRAAYAVCSFRWR